MPAARTEAGAGLRDAIARAQLEGDDAAEEAATDPDMLPPPGTGDDEPEPEPEPEPAPTPSPEPNAEQQARKLDKEMVRHEKALRTILAVEDELREAPFEGVIGFLLPGIYAHQPNEKYKVCPTCAGMGDVLTGSVKMGNETQPCPHCGGRGYLERRPASQPPAGVAPIAEGNGQPEDEFGTPGWMGDPAITPQP